MYWIDPSGQGICDDPIYVDCNMISGKNIHPLHLNEGNISTGLPTLLADTSSNIAFTISNQRSCSVP